MDASTVENTTAKDFENKIGKWKQFDKKKDLAGYLLKLNKKEAGSRWTMWARLPKRSSKSI